MEDLEKLHKIRMKQVEIGGVDCTCSGFMLQTDGCTCRRGDLKAELDEMVRDLICPVEVIHNEG